MKTARQPPGTPQKWPKTASKWALLRPFSAVFILFVECPGVARAFLWVSSLVTSIPCLRYPKNGLPLLPRFRYFGRFLRLWRSKLKTDSTAAFSISSLKFWIPICCSFQEKKSPIPQRGDPAPLFHYFGHFLRLRRSKLKTDCMVAFSISSLKLWIPTCCSFK